MTTTNALHVIAPYMDNLTGLWVFDDPSVGLVKEPFIMGIPLMIHVVTEHAGITNPEQGFRLIFADQSFPGAQIRLDRLYPDRGGAWYMLAEMDLDGDVLTPEIKGWLCPALFRYFAVAPEELYVRVESLTAQD